ncbi:hypothetical protein ACF1BN_00250 [Streptomyces sp. NPDC014861]|uniref:hypothetical protein n=1 Tax=Streptomyces sp. NPDC014861 TaxID=3364923 RepID=UPI0036F79088
MVEELAEAVVRATGAAARGVAALFTVPETFAAAAEVATAAADSPREKKDRKDEQDRDRS